MTGRLDIIMGPMFSGKSSTLINEGLRKRSVLTDLNKILLINSSLDSRCDEEIQSHNKITIPAKKVLKLMELTVTNDYKYADTLLIDESQFFEDLVAFTNYALNDNKHLIVGGLDGDYKQEKFGEILSIIPKAETVTKLCAYCKICADGITLAPFTKRIIVNDAQCLVGGAGDYISVCRKHLHEQ